MLPPASLSARSDLLGDRLSTAKADLALHAQSESHWQGPPPDAIAYPISTAEVAANAAISARHRIPLIAWGAGTSLEGHDLAFQGGITVDFRHMNTVSYTHLDVY